MRTTALLLWTVIALLASAPSAAQMTTRGVVFAVTVAEDGAAVLQPVTVLVPDGFTMPVHEPSDSATRATRAGGPRGACTTCSPRAFARAPSRCSPRATRRAW